MYQQLRIGTVIPALNEASTIGDVIVQLQQLEHRQQIIIDHIIVGNNGSSDNTADIARKAGAQVVDEARLGYGQACLAALAHMPTNMDIIVFIDADGSSAVSDIALLLDHIIQGADLVIGSRTQGTAEKNALLVQQRLGNKLATWLIRLFWQYHYSDLGPLRAIRKNALQQLNMQDTTFGWTIEMQIKALQQQLTIKEIPVHYRCRQGGKSKISGTIQGTLRAGYVILYTIFKLRFVKSRTCNA
ncbi:MAG: glycosyltransferase family 2 protein [Gammaproteobacteria bacterium]